MLEAGGNIASNTTEGMKRKFGMSDEAHLKNCNSEI